MLTNDMFRSFGVQIPSLTFPPSAFACGPEECTLFMSPSIRIFADAFSESEKGRKQAVNHRAERERERETLALQAPFGTCHVEIPMLSEGGGGALKKWISRPPLRCGNLNFFSPRPRFLPRCSSVSDRGEDDGGIFRPIFQHSHPCGAADFWKALQLLP